MKRYAILYGPIIFFSILQLYTGCSDSIALKDDYEKLIPLKVGNKWNYIVTFYDSLNNITSQTKYSESVIRDTMIEGKRWYVLSSDPKNCWYTNSEYGFWRIDNNNIATTQSKMSLVYKYPAHEGESYDYYDVLDMRKKISVPAGTYSCMQLRGNGHFPYPQYFDSFEVFIAPGVGKIKWVGTYRTPLSHLYTAYTYELYSYVVQ